jgi:hypothetical protein
MLREILTNGYIDKNIYLSQKSSSPKKSNSTIKKPNSIKQLNLYQTQKNLDFNSKPIFEEKIEIIKQRPDYILNQNNESTNPTMNNNKQSLYSNEKTKYIKSTQNINNSNINIKEICNNNEYSEIGELESNTNNNNIEHLKDIIINNSKNNKNTKSNTKKNNSYTFKEKNENNTGNKTSKNESEQNLEFNMTMLTPEGVDKIKLLEDYIAQIKENANEITENRIQELQSQKEQLEYNVKFLSNNILLSKKKFNDNIKIEKNLLLEKEKAGYDSKKATKDAFNLQKELPSNRVEIEIMKNQITQAKEETKNINNYLIEIERQTKEIQDEIKKINVKISAAIKDKDKIVNEITAMKKKNSILRNKIYKAENSANEFLFYVGQLAKSTEKIKIK